jgi:hypothetical protein
MSSVDHSTGRHRDIDTQVPDAQLARDSLILKSSQTDLPLGHYARLSAHILPGSAQRSLSASRSSTRRCLVSVYDVCFLRSLATLQAQSFDLGL